MRVLQQKEKHKERQKDGLQEENYLKEHAYRSPKYRCLMGNRINNGYLSTPNSKKSESESVSVALLALPVTWDIFQLQIVNNN